MAKEQAPKPPRSGGGYGGGGYGGGGYGGGNRYWSSRHKGTDETPAFGPAFLFSAPVNRPSPASQPGKK